MPTIFKTIIPYVWDLPSGYKTRSPADSDDVGESRRAFRFCLFKKLFEAYFASYFLEERDLKAKVKHCVIKFSLWATFKKLQCYLTHKKVSFKAKMGDGAGRLSMHFTAMRGRSFQNVNKTREIDILAPKTNFVKWAMFSIFVATVFKHTYCCRPI